MPGQMIGLLDGDSLTLRTADAPPLCLARAVDRRRFRDGAVDADFAPSPGSSPRRSDFCCTPATTSGRRTNTIVDGYRDRFTGVKVQLLPSGPLSVLAPAAASDDAVNLLQGALAVASPPPARLAFVARRRGAGSLAALPASRRTRIRTQPAAQERSRARRQHPGRLPRGHAGPAERHQREAARRATPRCASRWRRWRRPAAGTFGHCQRTQCSAGREDRGHQLSRGHHRPAHDAPSAASLDAIGQQLRSATWEADIMEIGASGSGDTYRGRLQIRKAGA